MLYPAELRALAVPRGKFRHEGAERGLSYRFHPTLASVDGPAQRVLATEGLGYVGNTGGDDWTTGCLGYEADMGTHQKSSDYCAGRYRHNYGSVYLLADTHAKWFRSPGSWRAPSTLGVAWKKSLTPNASAWFRED